MVGVDRPVKARSMHIQKPLRIAMGNNFHRIGSLPLFFIKSTYTVNMNMSARVMKFH